MLERRDARLQWLSQVLARFGWRRSKDGLFSGEAPREHEGESRGSSPSAERARSMRGVEAKIPLEEVGGDGEEGEGGGGGLFWNARTGIGAGAGADPSPGPGAGRGDVTGGVAGGIGGTGTCEAATQRRRIVRGLF